MWSSTYRAYTLQGYDNDYTWIVLDIAPEPLTEQQIDDWVSQVVGNTFDTDAEHALAHAERRGESEEEALANLRSDLESEREMLAQYLRRWAQGKA